MSNQIIYAVVRAERHEGNEIVKLYIDYRDAKLHADQANNEKTSANIIYYVEDYEVYG